jgi:hypothetical protein
MSYEEASLHLYKKPITSLGAQARERLLVITSDGRAISFFAPCGIVTEAFLTNPRVAHPIMCDHAQAGVGSIWLSRCQPGKDVARLPNHQYYDPPFLHAAVRPPRRVSSVSLETQLDSRVQIERPRMTRARMRMFTWICQMMKRIHW